MAKNPHISRHWSWHPEPVQASTAVERVYASVSADIVGGTLPGGTLITEGEVAERFDVSRTPVREAFLLMESQGLLRLFPKKGAVVTSHTPEETAHLLQVRIMLESRAVELQTAGREQTTSGASGEQRIAADLAALIAVQRAAAEQDDLPAFARADHQFHARIVAGSGNPIIDDFYAQLGPRLARLTCLTARTNTADLQRFMDDHARLAELLASADPRGYEELLRRHVAAT
ncbi:GntR family transcriptional regulator [Arthrobacter psychrolactophilus]|nr:GntR family transcriptional regulator [Arthrobacter psychrolactophilus]